MLEKGMVEKRERQSNYELLRIIAMLFIVASHWGWAFVNADFSGVSNLNNAWYHIFRSFGQVGNVLFIMISGYFLYKGKFKILSIVRLVLEVIFYNIVLLITGFLIVKFTGSTNVNYEWYYNIFMVLSKCWFLDVYLVLYLIHPFINKLISSINKNGFRLLLIILIIVLSLLPSLNNELLENNSIVYNLFFFVLIYLIGAYIRKYKEDFVNTKLYIIGLVFSLVFFVVSNIFFWEVQQRNNICLIFMCFCLFVLFSKLKLKGKLINTIASTTFGIYLLHENPVFRFFLWKDMLLQNQFLTSPYFILVSIGAVLCVFLVCSLIDLFRQYVFEKPIFRFFSSNQKISLWVSKIDSVFDLGTNQNQLVEEEMGDNKAFYFLFMLFIGYAISYVLTKTISMSILNSKLIFLLYLCILLIVFCIVRAVKNKKEIKE